ELIMKGVSSLPTSAVVSMIVAAAAAIFIEIMRIVTKGRFPLSAVSIGLGVVLPPEATFAMWVGATIFWLMGRKHKTPGTKGHEFWVEGMEPICAGLISGSALVGIGNAIVNVLL
ncbi:MAG: OPT/YSL family transporter, partial [Tepidisphaeraceae bacterium]